VTLADTPRIDPELLRQLAVAELTGCDLACIVSVQQTPEAGDPEKLQCSVGALLGRVALDTGEQAEDVNVMALMATAYVSGSASFLRDLIARPEILAAVAANPTQA
jgi:hypothetical protein